ncbi:hypothetical protein CAOG_03383 [Capsaspora owczarzaki ATCC 30864]|uniref:SANT domain-containing protein n=1 Tax=Capsaspora owczarzaki (strain ATCC 30864) TaxID=595528 RepID=A0A0D2UBJ0_CAPO3|nr:hypothetical protein CAOG_03383 [Capsaspora owczarzaki ATCC 30864]KJE92406.1 hypothetical protein CAOG_003383 [Capsaspora owczarzaki ATCC 30864]|eukprot:XP_004364222.1 hypothetical protein CAOG_03383 [Capsaspora owczarzaki ATCC 30864]
MRLHGKNWRMVSQHVGTRSDGQCRDFYNAFRKKLKLDSMIGLGQASTASPEDDVDIQGEGDFIEAAAGALPFDGVIPAHSIPSVTTTLPDGTKQLVTYWTRVERERLIEGLKQHAGDWSAVAQVVQTKTATQVRNFFHTYRQQMDLDQLLSSTPERRFSQSSVDEIGSVPNATAVANEADSQHVGFMSDHAAEVGDSLDVHHAVGAATEPVIETVTQVDEGSNVDAAPPAAGFADSNELAHSDEEQQHASPMAGVEESQQRAAVVPALDRIDSSLVEATSPSLNEPTLPLIDEAAVSHEDSGLPLRAETPPPPPPVVAEEASVAVEAAPMAVEEPPLEVPAVSDDASAAYEAPAVLEEAFAVLHETPVAFKDTHEEPTAAASPACHTADTDAMQVEYSETYPAQLEAPTVPTAETTSMMQTDGHIEAPEHTPSFVDPASIPNQPTPLPEPSAPLDIASDLSQHHPPQDDTPTIPPSFEPHVEPTTTEIDKAVDAPAGETAVASDVPDEPMSTVVAPMSTEEDAVVADQNPEFALPTTSTEVSPPLLVAEPSEPEQTLHSSSELSQQPVPADAGEDGTVVAPVDAATPAADVVVAPTDAAADTVAEVGVESQPAEPPSSELPESRSPVASEVASAEEAPLLPPSTTEEGANNNEALP